jgi:hypothetical protein
MYLHAMQRSFICELADVSDQIDFLASKIWRIFTVGPLGEFHEHLTDAITAIMNKVYASCLHNTQV